MNASDLDRLRFIRSDLTAPPLERLRDARDSLILLRLYQERWPAAFRKSKTDLFFPSQEGNGLYSEREVEFLRRLETVLPLNADLMLDWDERASAIPLAALAYDDERALTPGEALLVTLGKRTLSHEYDPGELTAPLQLLPTEDVDLPAFEKRCRAIDPTLRRITVALDVGGNCSGNFWVDTTDLFMMECACYPDWSNEAINNLIAELRTAMPLFRVFEQIATWLTASRARRRALAKAWNLSQVTRKEALNAKP